MDEEKPNEENTESRDKPEEKEMIDEETSVENKEEVGEESAEAPSDSNIEEINNETESLVDNSNKTGEPVSEPVKNSEPSGEANVQEEKPSEPEPTPVEEVKEEVKETVEKIVPKSKEGKEGSFMPMFFIMIISLVIAFAWDKVPAIQNSVHAVLDPSAGVLLYWNLTIGMFLIVLIISFLTTFIQKYATDQKALRELKKQQKILQEEMKKYKDRPEKVAELSKKQLQFIPKTFKLTSRSIMYTGIPFILFFRWFTDVFTAMEAETGIPIRFLGFLSWFWFYLILTMIFSSILRKVFKVV
jgi:uncharacterized membrane protein (DUF106 family)